MIYELIDTFYVKASDSEPRHRAAVTISNTTRDSLRENGFLPLEICDEYADFWRETSENELMGLTTEENIPEMLNVFTCGETYERIDLEALQLDPLDDEGNLPTRGACNGDYSVVIEDGYVGLTHGDETRYIRFREICDEYDFLTTLDIIDCFNSHPEKMREVVDSYLLTENNP